MTDDLGRESGPPSERASRYRVITQAGPGGSSNSFVHDTTGKEFHRKTYLTRAEAQEQADRLNNG